MNYILIADSGSTKTDWILLSAEGIVKRVKTIGFNPYFQSKDTIADELIRSLLPFIKDEVPRIVEIIYYGAGCSTPENCEILNSSIGSVFKNVIISINHDLLAAARALCGTEKGIACILGTGSNSCLYDGKEVVENVPSVGYLFGDHGSGACIGKYLIQDYFNETLPPDLSSLFEAEGYHREIILDNLYKRSMPSRYLASTSVFLGKNRGHAYVEQLLNYCFTTFFQFQVSKYTNAKNLPVHFVGSIAFHYRDVLETVAESEGFILGNIIQSPAEGLIAYHQKQIAELKSFF